MPMTVAVLMMLGAGQEDSARLQQSVSAHLKERWAAVFEAPEKWNEGRIFEVDDASVRAVATGAALFVAQVGCEYPVPSPTVVRLVLAVTRKEGKVTELVVTCDGIKERKAATAAEAVAFFNALFAADADKAQRAAAIATLYPACPHFGIGKSWVAAADFEVAGAKAAIKKGVEAGKDVTQVVEYDDDGRIKSLTRADRHAHPKCHEHRAAAREFLVRTRPLAELRGVVAHDDVRRLLPEHWLYEVLEEGRVVGFVLCKQGAKECRYVDRSTLDGLPSREALAPLLK